MEYFRNKATSVKGTLNSDFFCSEVRGWGAYETLVHSCWTHFSVQERLERRERGGREVFLIKPFMTDLIRPFCAKLYSPGLLLLPLPFSFRAAVTKILEPTEEGRLAKN